jgi:hypothetical protein
MSINGGLERLFARRLSQRQLEKEADERDGLSNAMMHVVKLREA